MLVRVKLHSRSEMNYKYSLTVKCQQIGKNQKVVRFGHTDEIRTV